MQHVLSSDERRDNRNPDSFEVLEWETKLDTGQRKVAGCTNEDPSCNVATIEGLANGDRRLMEAPDRPTTICYVQYLAIKDDFAAEYPVSSVRFATIYY